MIAEEKQKEKEKNQQEAAQEKNNELNRSKYEESAQYALDEACHKYERLQIIQAAINDENAASKISGVKDKKRLITLGRQAHAFEKLLKQHKELYNKRSGKSWHSSQCKQ